MRKFRFRFQKVLEVRETREKCSRSVFAQSLRLWRAERAALEAARVQHQEMLRAMTEARSGQSSLPALLLEPGVRVSGARLLTQGARTAEAARQASQRRQELTCATRSRQVVEKLRDRRRRDHDYWQGWEEQKTVDEVALGMFARHRGQVL